MKRISFKKCQPTAGTYVAAFCAGMARRPFDTEGNANTIRSRGDGARIGRMLPRRLAKRRATRILREHRAGVRRWYSRGNMAAATAMPTDAGFTRFPESAATVRARINAEAERISVEANREPYAAAMKAAEQAIRFTFEGVNYTAPAAFYDSGACVLPDGRVLRATGFLESLPPQPQGIHVVDEPAADLPRAEVQP